MASMYKEVNDYVLSFSTCAPAMVSQNCPTEELMPLTTPQHPWSHRARDFLTDLVLGGTQHYW